MAALESSQSRLSRLVLISAGALLILGLLTLGMALRNAEAFAREEARSRSTDTLEALHANLQRASILGLAPVETKFEVRSGRLLLTEAEAASDLDKDETETEVREQTLRERMDVVEKQRGLEAVLDALDRELDDPSSQGITTLLLMSEAAWRATRAIEGGNAGLTERRNRYLEECEKARERIRSESDAAAMPLSVDRSLFLLRARAGMTSPSWSSEMLSRLDPVQREAILERAADLSHEEFARSRFLDALAAADRIWARKSLLEQVRTRIGQLLGRQEAWNDIVGDRILLWFPEAGPGESGEEAGQGALLDQDLLLARLRESTAQTQQAARADLLPMTWSGTLVRQP